MVMYQNYTTVEGVERVKAYSNQNVYIERDGALYSEADDFAYQNRKYAETDIPIDIEPSPIDEDIVQKAEAIDPADIPRKYTETDEPIEGEPQNEAEQKAEAYDYLTGRSATNE